jgi:hypothetical protein
MKPRNDAFGFIDYIMTLYRPNGAQIAPCICSKARHALDLINIAPTNLKTCSFVYWVDACDAVANHYGNQQNIENAIAQYAAYMQL